ncbi:MAG: hypothetical protein JNL57_13585 [Bacteroidetes bacterium]|nr:hypothetical protein [Bacteroidota bacterium]
MEKKKKSYAGLTPFESVKKYLDENHEIRHNLITNRLESRPKGENAPWMDNDKLENDLLVELLEHNLKQAKSSLAALLGSNYIKPYHPVKEYFDNLEPWDGFDHFSELCAKIHTNAPEEFRHHLKKHLMRCVASVLVKGYFNKQCFVFHSERQSLGKSSLIRWLVPEKLKKYISDAVLQWQDKDANIALGENWFINMDELAELDRSELNSLKATLSRDMVKVRRPYGKTSVEIPRLANFWGSTNDLQFLTDLTGNVRWLVFEVIYIDFKYTKIDKDQLWAQIYNEFRNLAPRKPGEVAWYELSQEEQKQNDLRNQKYMLSSPELEAINRYLLPGDPKVSSLGYGTLYFGQAFEIMKRLNEMAGTSFRNVRSFGRALNAANFKRISRYVADRQMSLNGYFYYEHQINYDVDLRDEGQVLDNSITRNPF